jgi:hypothetical protein
MSFMENELVQKAIWNFAVPLVVLYVLQQAFVHGIAFAKSLWVQGKANEWILIMRSGKMIKAGIGLNTFKGPFDQVARFPAKIHRVQFSTEQVTKEMQGIHLTSTLVWTILRTGEGPFNAYKNLGADLNSRDPRTANDALISMASAIVRSCIANSTIAEMMRDRKGIQDRIQKEMFEVVKGWGVWLETFEVTEVKIASSSLFKDLQTSYRENIRKESELFKMKINNEIAIVQTEVQGEKDKFQISIDEKKREIQTAHRNEYNLKNDEFSVQNQAITQQKDTIKFDHDQEHTKLDNELNRKKIEGKTAFDLHLGEIGVKKLQEEQKKKVVKQESAGIHGARAAARTAAEERAVNEGTRLKAELESSNIDETLLRDMAYDTAKTAIGSKQINSFNVQLNDGSDKAGAVLDGLLNKWESAKDFASTK